MLSGPTLIAHGGFAWAASAAETPEEKANPWTLLDKPLPAGTMQAVDRFNTAMYSLHKSLGDTIEVVDRRGNTVPLVIVGLLKNSIFQGDLIIAERPFSQSLSRYQRLSLLLVDAGSEPSADVRKAFEQTLGDYGSMPNQPPSDWPASRRAKHLPLHLSESRRAGAAAWHIWAGHGATTQRAGASRRTCIAPRPTQAFAARLAWLVMIENALLLLGGLTMASPPPWSPSCPTPSAAEPPSPGNRWQRHLPWS